MRLIKFILTSLDYELGSRRAGFLPMIGEGIFTQDGEPWKHSREILRRQFVRMQYQDLKTFQGPVNDLLAELNSAPSGTVDLQPFFFRFTLTTTTSLIFGEPFADLDPTDHEQFGDNFTYAGLVTAMRTRLAKWCWLYNPPKFRKACLMVKRYAMQYVTHALTDMKENGAEKAAERHPFIIDLYQELRDPVLVRDQLMNVLMAGRDTTACLLSWSL
jgi:cytochrome P450